MKSSFVVSGAAVLQARVEKNASPLAALRDRVAEQRREVEAELPHARRRVTMIVPTMSRNALTICTQVVPSHAADDDVEDHQRRRRSTIVMFCRGLVW